MRVILFGKQASGKGTQAKLISEKYRIPHVSTGDICRETAKQNTELGRKIRALIDAGKLAPDDLMNKIVISKTQKMKGFILDGYPRNLVQANAFEKVPVDTALLIEISDQEAIKRLSVRRICSKCGEIYNLVSRKPKKEGKCDKCSANILQREDDKPEAIRKRLETYKQVTAPVVDFYKKKGLLKKFDGAEPIERIFAEICRILDTFAEK